MWVIFCFLAVAGQLASANGDCDMRYFQHYEHKNCHPIPGEDGCPERFDCQPVSDQLRMTCLYKGKYYDPGSEVPIPCEHCTCRSRPLEGAYLDCDSVDCPDWETKNASCYMGYENPDACCPKVMCPPEEEKMRLSCYHRGKAYHLGQIVQEFDDMCRTCICTRDWDLSGGSGCRETECMTAMYAPYIRKGCLPIYSKHSCCVTGTYCGAVTGSKPLPLNVKYTNFLCHYRDRYYEKASKIYPVDDFGKNWECTCLVPPDFTCIRQ